jgi:hypothetical protein
MREIIIVILVITNFLFAWAIYSSWQRNDRLFDINASLYMTNRHLDEHIETLKIKLNDRSSMCSRVLHDQGLLVFE